MWHYSELYTPEQKQFLQTKENLWTNKPLTVHWSFKVLSILLFFFSFWQHKLTFGKNLLILLDDRIKQLLLDFHNFSFLCHIFLVSWFANICYISLFSGIIIFSDFALSILNFLLCIGFFFGWLILQYVNPFWDHLIFDSVFFIFEFINIYSFCECINTCLHLCL